MATVLVVHDDPFSLRIVGKILARDGHACLHAADETEAWKWLRINPFVNLVVLDDDSTASKGEHFFRSLRDDLVLQGIPVVVYVGQAERTTIFRYAELGVQALLAKPYKGDALLDEVTRTKKTDWISRIMDSEEAVCTRMGLPKADYYSLMGTAAKNIEDGLAEIRSAPIKTNDDIRVRKFLKTMLNQSNELGLSGMKICASALARAVNSVDDAGVRRAISSAESMRACLQARVHKYLGVHLAPPNRGPNVALPPVKTDLAGEWDHRSPSFASLTTKRPMSAFGGHLEKLATLRLLTDLDLSVHMGTLGQSGVLNEALKLIRMIWDAPTAARDEALALVESEFGFRETYLHIALRLGDWGEDAELDPGSALDWLGIDRTLVLLSLARFARATRLKSPLNLGPLRTHTLLMVLLGYELGTMLRLKEHHLPAATGFAWNIGCWLMALAEPTAYGLSLAESAAGVLDLRQTEKLLFGYSTEEIGLKFLVSNGAQEMVREVGRYRVDGGEAKSPSVAGTACVMRVAEPLAWAALTSADAVASVTAGLKHPGHPIWAQWSEAGLTLPLDVEMLAANMTKEVESALWVVETVLAWADQTEKK